MPIYHDDIPDNGGVAIHTGFPNPAIDASLKDLNLNTLLVAHQAASYFMRIEGNSWETIGIYNGDIIIIDRSLNARTNDLIAWWHHDGFTLSYRNQMAPNATSWGVVTATIHQFRSVA